MKPAAFGFHFWMIFLLVSVGTIQAQEASPNSLSKWEQQFRDFDINKDGLLSLEESLAGAVPEKAANLKQEFTICDFDGNQRLSFQEYCNLPSISVAIDRIGIPDPVRLAAEQELAEANTRFASADQNQDSQLDASEWEVFSKDTFYAGFLPEFDRDSDKQVSLAELKAGLELAYGLTDPQGVVLRRDSGQILTWRTYVHELDRNQDRQLSRDEVLKALSPDAEKRDALFRELDKNGDDQLSIAELAAQERFWIDVLGKFLAFDQDQDGELSPEEVAAKAAPWEQGYVNSQFPAYDVDRNGKLSFLEYRASPLGNQVLIWMNQRDQDHDGLLSLREFHPTRTLAFLGQSKLYFDRLDQNQNGTLEQNEYAFQIDVNKVPADIAFQHFDVNKDGELSLEELLAGAPATSHAALRQRWWIVDFDRSSGLTFQEYRSLLSVSLASAGRVGIPDPVRLAAEQELAEANTRFASADQNQDSQLDASEWEVFSKDTFYAGFLPEFDRDSDKQVSLAELKAGLELAYGLTDPQGVVLRRDSGQILTWRTYVHELDRNQDRQLSRDEVLKALSPDAEKRDALFRELDKNGDDQLSIAELAAQERFWIDVLGKFLAFDQDQDGELSPEEVAAKAAPWEQGYVNSQFPAYDVDRNGKLSFLEYRASPLGNQVLIWMNQRDQDHDGLLSLREFHPTRTLAFLGQSKLYFDRLDQNQNGTLEQNEYAFQIDVNKVPADIAFQHFDVDRDNAIAMKEFTRFQKYDGTDPVARQRHHSQLMRLEEAFQAIDKDRDGQVTFEEYQISHRLAASVNSGKKAPSKVTNAIANKYAKNSESQEGLNWRWITLIGANVLLLGGIGWLVLKLT